MHYRAKTANIKLSLVIEKRFWGNNKFFAKRNLSRNFRVHRSCGRKYVFVIFCNGHVNATGIPHFSEIGAALRELETFLSLPRNSLGEYKIDNICSRGRTEFELILLSPLLHAISKHLSICTFAACVVSVQYQPEKFPSLHVKTRLGSILIFGTGKFVFVGYRTAADAFYLTRILKHFLGRDDHEREYHCQIRSDHCLRT